LTDLVARHDAGALSSGERLALAVFVGGQDEPLPWIDGTQVECGDGTYRAFVMVKADRDRMLLVFTMPGRLGLVGEIERRIRDKESLIEHLPPGCTVQAFEYDPTGRREFWVDDQPSPPEAAR